MSAVGTGAFGAGLPPAYLRAGTSSFSEFLGAVAPERLPYAGFRTADKNGKTILAVLRDEPDSDPKVRLGINISYAGS